MATQISNLASHFSIFIILMSAVISIPVTGETDSFIKPLDQETLQLGKEKLTHFQLYWHDIISGGAPTAVAITNGQKNSSTGFGMIRMIDNPLTEGPELKSKLIGRAQGFYGSTGQETVSLLMSMNFVFLVGKYNGSTITVHGRNEVFNKVREMPVIGGSGLFRFARGYVQASTHTFDPKTGDAIVLYNIYVMHY